MGIHYGFLEIILAELYYVLPGRIGLRGAIIIHRVLPDVDGYSPFRTVSFFV